MAGYSLAPHEKGRAWLEIDLAAIESNAAALRSALPEKCELMAVVKADAYGHGAAQVAARLWKCGVGSFAVATAGEAVGLRKSGLDGNILVLGCTHPGDAGVLYENSLTQLVVDGAYADVLSNAGYRIDVHVAIDSGMHRLGIDSSNHSEIESVFKCKNLNVTGTATHLASSDSLAAGDVGFTNRQIENFRLAVEAMQSKGHNTGKLHIQASYGIFNYPGLECDYARAGIALYGVMSHDGAVVKKAALKPALAMRARVAQVRLIGAGESVSYGRAFTASSSMKIATVGVGYADGVPRQASGNGACCIAHGHMVPVIGRVCMDLLMIDVTEVDQVRTGDIVTVIGSDGGETIRCEDLAAVSGTITNDVLCRLGSRLPRIYN